MTDLHRDISAVWGESERVVPFIKGRVALYAILRAAGIGPGDEVLIPGFTCVVVAAAVRYVGARAVFYDISPRSFNGDPELAKISIGKATKAVIIQHSFGAPAFLSDLVDVCRERGILLIEDCAHSLGARYADNWAGMIGDAAFTSFQWSKTVTTGLGGLARLNDEQLLAKMPAVINEEFDEPSLVKSISLMVLSSIYQRFFSPGLYWRAQASYRAAAGLGLIQGSSSDEELMCSDMPRGYRELFGARRREHLKGVLSRAADNVSHRVATAAMYDDWCRGRDIRTQDIPDGAISVFLRYPLLVRGRDALLEQARSRRIEIGSWFDAPLHPKEANASAFGYRQKECPLAERMCDMIINLPTHPGVKKKDVEKILAFVG